MSTRSKCTFQDPTSNNKVLAAVVGSGYHGSKMVLMSMAMMAAVILLFPRGVQTYPVNELHCQQRPRCYRRSKGTCWSLSQRKDHVVNNNQNDENSSRQQQQQHTVHVISLPAYETSPSSSIPYSTFLLIKRLWDWKDDVLGDGRDYFVPRPKTLQALNELLQQQLQAQECVILSNCARFDIFLIFSEPQNVENASLLGERVASCLLQQLYYYNKNKNSYQNPLSSLLSGPDRPDRLCLQQATTTTTTTTQSSFDATAVAKCLDQLNGPEDVARYLCLIAAGMQSQRRRPDRPVVFRPFSSRDAHIMLQLKRTRETLTKKSTTLSSSRLQTLFDTALQSGKAARDPQQVPEILRLKKYGTSSSTSRYSLGEPPEELCDQACKVRNHQEKETAKDSCVVSCALIIMCILSHSIFVIGTIFLVANMMQLFLRESVRQMALQKWGIHLDSKEGKQIRSMLHQPLIQMRKGQEVNVNSVLDNIHDQINEVHKATSHS